MGKRSETKITLRTIEALKPGEQVWDKEINGFGARVQLGRPFYFFAYRTQSGRRRQMTLGEHASRQTLEAARTLAEGYRGDVSKGKDPAQERDAKRQAGTVEALTKRFLDDYAAAHNKPSTVAEYERLIRVHIVPKLGKLAVNDVMRDDVREWHSSFRKSRVAGNRALALLKTIFNQAEEWGIRKLVNPARKVKMFPERGRERFLTSEEIARLGDTLRLAETQGIPWTVDEDGPNAKHARKKNRVTIIDPYAAAAIRLLLLTGARLREILHARWEWVDWERGLLVLPDSKTGKKPIYLPAPALAVLESLPRIAGNPHIIAGHKPRKQAAGDGKKPEGTPRADLKKPWAAVVKHAGLEGVRLHDLRHSFASIGAGASLGLPIIGKLLGHTQPTTTARYSHLDADPLHRAANLIGGHIAAALDGRKGELVRLKPRTGTQS